MNWTGEIMPALRVLPADQRLDLADAAGLEIDDRLVVDAQLVALDGVAQVGLQLQPLHRLGVHARIEDGVAGLALRLGPVHRHVGIAQQVAPGGRGRGAQRDADADAWRRPRGRPAGPARRALLDAVGDLRASAIVVDVLQQDRELVAAQPRDGVLRPQRQLEALGQRDQQLVAGLVARGCR